MVLQSHFFEDTPTVIVAPLIADDGHTAYTLASLRIRFNERPYALALAELGNVERQAFGRALGTLREHEDAIRRVLDRVFNGF